MNNNINFHGGFLLKKQKLKNMRINSNYNNNINFTSRNSEIRFADDIARKVNKEFPRLSSTLVRDFNNIDKFQLFRYYLTKKIDVMRSVKSAHFEAAISIPEKLSALTSNIKKFNIGNCGESAQLAEIAARVNDIKDCHCTLLTTADKDIDHEVLFVHNNGKPYIIDAWLGFADYLPQATERYRSEFRKHFDKKIESNVYYDGVVSHDPTGEIFSKRYSENNLKQLYPNLILKNTTTK